MAEGSDQEKTEPASPRRLEQAREEGDIPRSREIATCTVLLAAGVGMMFTGEGLVHQLGRLLASGMSFDRSEVFEFDRLVMRLAADIVNVLIAFAPLAGLMFIVAIVSPILVGGWIFSGKAFMPKFSRLNPISGLGNLVSTRNGVELIKAILKAILVGGVSWMVVSSQLEQMLALAVEPFNSGSAHLGKMVLSGFITIVCSLVVIVLIDGPYQLWHYANKLKMTREEVRQESKESDGDPHIKAKIRQLQREMAQRRMMTEVPTADVIVTNPTHYAVALKYTDGKMRAPKVVAKGADEVAAKIRELAAENRVPLLEAPPLARALYTHTELGDEIPEGLYTAVAEVLAYVFQLRTYSKMGGVRPEEPSAIDVPPQLDPHNPASQKPADNGPMQ
ncbi:MAG: flagellar biosynthesis protein FlhB [Burkholderiales bacterium]